MKKIIIYTDGGCRGNLGIGGWGVWMVFGKRQKKLSGGALETTNNRMELTAVIEALKALKSNKIPIELYSDSTYVLTGIDKWLLSWKQRNWRTTAKKTVKNIDLWQQLEELVKSYHITWHWVKGHSNNKGNDIADSLANQAMDKLMT